jgi:hypothetical protein
MIWREKRILLIVLALLLAANAAFYFTYGVQYEKRLEDMDQRLADAERGLRQARASRIRTERTFQSYRQIERDITRIYNEHWATQPQRLTAMIKEVKRLAEASGTPPPSYGFTHKEVEVKSMAPAVRRRRDQALGASEVGITFGVDGSYAQIRRLINLLELSEQFVIIDQVGLSAGDGERLTMTLQLKTLFRDDDSPVASDRL